MPINAQDSDNIPRLLLVDADGKLVLGPSSEVIGSVNEARGKTILYDVEWAAGGNTTLRTVTAGKTYYLLMAGLIYESTIAEEIVTIQIDDYNHLILEMAASITATYNEYDAGHAEISFPHPIPITAGKVIRVTSGHANMGGRGWIIGWEE